MTQQLAATDPNGVPVIFAKSGEPQHGTASVSADGMASYTPSPYFYGTDSFTVSLSDSKGGSASGVVTVTVSYVNYPPVAHDDQLRIANTIATLSILSNDDNPNKDALTVTVLTQPPGGSVTVQNGSTVTFQPINSFTGPTTFKYRITNPSGSSSDATAQLVVGTFPGVVFLADETTLGTPELHFFDGFHTVRLSTPLQSGAAIWSFKIAPDSRHVAYIVNSPFPVSFPQVLVADITNPGSAQLIYSGVASSSFSNVNVELNHDASFALIVDSNSALALRTVLIQSANRASTTVGLSNPTVLQAFNLAFNPVSNEYYLQGQIGGSPRPMSGTGYTTLLAATTAVPDPLTQIGASYGGNDGEGSGHLLSITPDGRRVLHAAATYVPVSGGGDPLTWDLLVNDRATNTETYLYRKFTGLEFNQSRVEINADGSRACFSLNELPSAGTFYAASIWIADPSAPGAATAVTPITYSNFDAVCRWASDSKTIVYDAAHGGAPREPWVVDSTKPGVVSRLRESLSAGDNVEYWAIAPKAMTAVVAVLPNGGNNTTFYRAAIDSPGTSSSFFSITKYSASAIGLDSTGTAIKFLRPESVSGGLNTVARLHWVSTQINDYDLVLSRPDSSMGVLQAEFLPQ